MRVRERSPPGSGWWDQEVRQGYPATRGEGDGVRGGGGGSEKDHHQGGDGARGIRERLTPWEGDGARGSDREIQPPARRVMGPGGSERDQHQGVSDGARGVREGDG